MTTTDNRVTRAELERCYIEDVGWGANWRDDRVAKSIFEFMVSAHDFVETDHIVLDVSAGQSPYKPFFQHANYVALDARVGDPSWDFSKLDLIGDAMHMPIRNSSVDVVLNFVALEHYPEPWTFFTEVARVLKPGGKLFLFAPHVYQEHQRPYDFYRYTQFALADLCTRNGLAPEAIDPVCSVFFTVTKILEFVIESAGALGKNEDLLKYLNDTNASLKSIANQFEDAIEKLPEARDKISSLPMQYTLRASKAGVLVPDPHAKDRISILNAVMADPFEKRPIWWDGVAKEVSTAYSQRKYPVINGIPHFML